MQYLTQCKICRIVIVRLADIWRCLSNNSLSTTQVWSVGQQLLFLSPPDTFCSGLLHILLDIFIFYVSTNLMWLLKVITNVEIIFIERKKNMFKFLFCFLWFCTTWVGFINPWIKITLGHEVKKLKKNCKPQLCYMDSDQKIMLISHVFR